MKKILYFILPSTAFVLILFNMLYGHMFFDSSYDQDINKYSIYVHFKEEWNSYPGNVFFYDLNESSESFDYNSNQLQYQNQKSFVRLKHEFSNCDSSWKPPLYRYVVDSVRNYVEFIQGIRLNYDPYVSKFPNIVNDDYDLENQKYLSGGYAQFIPICTSKDSTSYDYAISINDENVGFDVFFVPSELELEKYLLGIPFEYYREQGCFVINHQSFSGNCNNVSSNSGLLVVIPDELTMSLTKIRISLHEKV